MPVKSIPDTSPRVIPMLVCRDPEAEIGFCERVLKAEVGVRRPGPDGHTIHAALMLGEARIIIQAEFPQFASREGSAFVALLPSQIYRKWRRNEGYCSEKK